MSDYRAGDVVYVKGTIVDIRYKKNNEVLHKFGVQIKNMNGPYTIAEIGTEIYEHHKTIYAGDRVSWLVNTTSRSPTERIGFVEFISQNKEYAFVNEGGKMVSVPVKKLNRLNQLS